MKEKNENNIACVEKMTLSEYENKYTKKQYARGAKSMLTIVMFALGILIFVCLLYMVLKCFDYNQILGIIASVFALIVYIFCFIVPLVKINKLQAFETNVNVYNATRAKKHNKKMREDIADKMIELCASTNDAVWYDSNLIGKLAIARQTKNDVEVKKNLTEIYEQNVKKVANNIIKDHAIKVGITTAISQSERLDTLFVCTYELNLIKDLVFLYGYRPSDAKLLKIYASVLRNSLISYGIQATTTNLATGIVQKMGGLVSSIPLLGSAISTVISSASQGLINGAMTVVIGEQTKKYLREEYKAQDILDNIDLNDDLEAEEALMEDVKEEILKTTKEIKKNKNTVVNE